MMGRITAMRIELDGRAYDAASFIIRQYLYGAVYASLRNFSIFHLPDYVSISFRRFIKL